VSLRNSHTRREERLRVLDHILKFMTLGTVIVGSIAICTALHTNNRRLGADIFLRYSDRISDLRRHLPITAFFQLALLICKSRARTDRVYEPQQKCARNGRLLTFDFNSLIRRKDSLFLHCFSLLICLGKYSKSRCGTKFPVCREFGWRQVRSALRRQPVRRLETLPSVS
jgi:hypothetical protein